MITSAEEMTRLEKSFLVYRFGQYTEESLFEADDDTLNEVSQEMINNFLESDLLTEIMESESMDLEDDLNLGEILNNWAHQNGELIE